MNAADIAKIVAQTLALVSAAPAPKVDVDMHEKMARVRAGKKAKAKPKAEPKAPAKPKGKAKAKPEIVGKSTERSRFRLTAEQAEYFEMLENGQQFVDCEAVSETNGACIQCIIGKSSQGKVWAGLRDKETGEIITFRSMKALHNFSSVFRSKGDATVRAFIKAGRG